MLKRIPEPFKRGKYYHFATYKNGRRTIKSTGCTKKNDARTYIAEFFDKAVQNRFFDTTFREYSDKYFLWDECPHTQRLLAERRTIGKRHVDQMRSSLTRYVWNDPISSMMLRDLTRGAVIDFRTRIFNSTKTPKRKNGLPNAANKALRALKIVLSEAAYREDISVNAAALVAPVRYDPKPQTILSAVQLRQILDLDLQPIDRVFFGLLAGTGMRSGELRALNWEKIQDDYRTIEISATMKNTVAHAESGPCKWGSNRTITAPDFLRTILRDWHRESKLRGPGDPVIYGKDNLRVGQTWTKKHLNQILDLWGKSPEPRPTPHMIRHAVNTALLIAGVSPLPIAHCLGWTPPVASRVQLGYTHLAMLDTTQVSSALQEAIYGASSEDNLSISVEPRHMAG